MSEPGGLRKVASRGVAFRAETGLRPRALIRGVDGPARPSAGLNAEVAPPQATPRQASPRQATRASASEPLPLRAMRA